MLVGWLVDLVLGSVRVYVCVCVSLFGKLIL